MTIWRDICSRLGANFDVAVHEDNLLLLNVPIPGTGETQETFVVFHEGSVGCGWVRVEAGFAEVSARSMAAAIEHVGIGENFGMGIGRTGEFATIRWTCFTETDLAHISSMTAAVARHAYQLSRYLGEGFATV